MSIQHNIAATALLATAMAMAAIPIIASISPDAKTIRLSNGNDNTGDRS